MRKPIFETKHVELQTKKAVYLTLVVSILLYGAESWCLTEELLDRLRVFHNQCIRTMCGVTLWHQWHFSIRNRDLRARMKIENLDHYISVRKLRWAGHVARMGHRRRSGPRASSSPPGFVTLGRTGGLSSLSGTQ